MKLGITIFEMLPMLFLALLNLAGMTSQMENDGKAYNVLIEVPDDDQGKVFSYSGAILNNRYILTAKATSHNAETLRNGTIITGYNHAKNADGTTTRLSASNSNKYDVENFWIIDDLLVLIKTKTTITFNTNVKPVDLPTGNELKLWKDPFTIPMNEKVTVAKWCPKRETEGSEENKSFNESVAGLWNNKSVGNILSRSSGFFLETVTEKRKCTLKTCYHEGGLIPSCIPNKSYHNCKLPLGAPMVYKNILIAIRYQSVSFKPNEKYVEDLYISVATYKKKIAKYMVEACKFP